MGEIVFLGLFLIACCYLLFLTFSFPVNILDKSGGAGLFPRIVLLFLMVFLIIRMVQLLCRKNKEPFVFLEMFQGTRLFYLIGLAVYVAALKVVGYFICTVLFLGVTINLLYKQQKGGWGSIKAVVIRNVLIVAFVLAMNFFFAKVLHVMLPEGILFQ